MFNLGGRYLVLILNLVVQYVPSQSPKSISFIKQLGHHPVPHYFVSKSSTGVYNTPKKKTRKYLYTYFAQLRYRQHNTDLHGKQTSNSPQVLSISFTSHHHLRRLRL